MLIGPKFRYEHTHIHNYMLRKRRWGTTFNQKVFFSFCGTTTFIASKKKRKKWKIKKNQKQQQIGGNIIEQQCFSLAMNAAECKQQKFSIINFVVNWKLL